MRESCTDRDQLWERIRRSTIATELKRVGVELLVAALETDSGPPCALNAALQAAMSEYARRAKPSLRAFVELIRCQTTDDYRPNKALVPVVHRRHCHGYEHLDALTDIAAEGVRVHLREPLPRQGRWPKNHPSATERIQVLRKNIRKEQDLFRCIVVDADIAAIWTELVFSPFGVVDKGAGDPRITGCVIHDLSFPEDASINSHTDSTAITTPTYEHCSSIAREILRCKRVKPGCAVKVTAGDVAAAYHNACTHSDCVYLFPGRIPEDNATVIDLCAAFRWTGSAGTYSVLGGAVAFVHGNSVDANHPAGFFNYDWVDDHVNIEPDVGTRCADAERSLRYAMAAVMGPRAVHEDKFIAWRPRQKVLGLMFDTSRETVSIPPDKITKAKRIVSQAYHASRLSRTMMRSLLGSLRHVATCVRPAQAFLQRLRAGEKNLHRCAHVTITPSMREDLIWWWHILCDPTINGVRLNFFRHASWPRLCRVHRRV
ncbi:hypothetical protein PR003_g614 [Phytophthora rubi]|uniref:Uncharacterized protein n=1 Tax=Phytophthora rubi TaxID=129364 RepID=A0A6A3PAG1_9STRA|nr:hypothetical protein PR001_g1796 [Phytophthora rubi]KAE9359647.1 hypothetical protein PR003_g614 [Phytophthora rubi]